MTVATPARARRDSCASPSAASPSSLRSRLKAATPSSPTSSTSVGAPARVTSNVPSHSDSFSTASVITCPSSGSSQSGLALV